MLDLRQLRRDSKSDWHDFRHRFIIGMAAAVLIFILPIIVGA